VSYLLYCVFRGPLPAALEVPYGAGGHLVFTANYRGLGVALSKLVQSNSTPDISTTQAYEAVVESFHRHLTVIPMRYGSRVDCPYDAATLLERNYETYGALLDELEGLAETGIQLLLDKARAGAESSPSPFVSRTTLFTSSCPAIRSNPSA
jgi:hypothetical protein